MGGRYVISGTQLGMIMAGLDQEALNKLAKDIENQWLFNSKGELEKDTDYLKKLITKDFEGKLKIEPY